MVYENDNKRFQTSKPFEGVIPNLHRRWLETESNWIREELTKYQNISKCIKCNGYRLKNEALAVKINNMHIGEITNLSISELFQWIVNLPKLITKKQQKIARRILKEIHERLFFLTYLERKCNAEG